MLDAARTALIPLRPLTIGDSLDGAFLIVRRNVRLMLGLPLVVAGAPSRSTCWRASGLWLALGDTAIEGSADHPARPDGPVLGPLLFYQCLVWMTAVLSRVSLRMVLGEGFAPAEGTLSP